MKKIFSTQEDLIAEITKAVELPYTIENEHGNVYVQFYTPTRSQFYMPKHRSLPVLQVHYGKTEKGNWRIAGPAHPQALIGLLKPELE